MSTASKNHELLEPFCMYFTVEQCLSLSISEKAKAELRASASTALLYTIWRTLEGATQRELIAAHDKEYHYESVAN